MKPRGKRRRVSRVRDDIVMDEDDIHISKPPLIPTYAIHKTMEDAKSHSRLSNVRPSSSHSTQNFSQNILSNNLHTSAATTNNPPSLSTLLPMHPTLTPPSDTCFTSALTNRTLTLTTSLPKTQKQSPQQQQQREKKGRRRTHSLPSNLPCPSKATLLSLSKLWQNYAVKALSVPEARKGEAAARLDLHGATIEVIKSRHVGLVGMKGIIVAETNGVLWLGPYCCYDEEENKEKDKKNDSGETVKSNHKKDFDENMDGDVEDGGGGYKKTAKEEVNKREESWRLRKIPKDGTVIYVKVGKRNLVYYLPALVMRSSERSAKKFKKKNIRIF